MTYDVYMHFPVIAIMTLFVGAFLVTLVGKRQAARNVIAGAAVLVSLTLLALLIKPVMVDGEIIMYWMGNWEPVEGYAIGIAIEVDALSLFFGLLITIAVACSAFYSFQYIKQDDARGSFFTLYLMLSGGVLGIVLSGDLFNIYVMLEVMTFAAVGLTAFIPMLMDTGGNAGSQTSVTIIRGLSLGEIRMSDLFKIIGKETRVAILCGLTLSLANFAKMMLLDRVGLSVSLVVCLTLIVTVTIAKITGCVLPIAAKRIGFDPAVMASPFITTIVDALSLIVYFNFASMLLHLG